jgi:DNA-binding transcriptional LysR family regulator
MDTKYLETVRKINETGSFRGAAEELSYAQSTITFQVRQLESEFGVRLFERSGGRMVLTEGGREIMPYIERVLDSAEALDSFCRRKTGEQDTLTIAAPESLVTYQLQHTLKIFKEKKPDVKLRLRCMNCFAIYNGLLGSGIDIAIHYDVGKYPSSFETSRIASFPLVLVGSPALTEKERDFVTAGQTKKLCQIQDDPDALSLKIFRQYLEDREITLEPDIEVWSIEAVKRSAMSNLGVAFLPRFTVEDELRSGELIELPAEIEDPSMTAVYAVRNDRWRSSCAELFLDILREEFPVVSGSD